jgi:hypothetical protein
VGWVGASHWGIFSFKALILRALCARKMSAFSLASGAGVARDSHKSDGPGWVERSGTQPIVTQPIVTQPTV